MPAYTQLQTGTGGDGKQLAPRVATTIDAVVISWADYVSHCKGCRSVVLKTHKWEWRNGPGPIGIHHVDCQEPYGESK